MQYVQVLQQTRINRIQAQEKELGAFTNKFSWDIWQTKTEINLFVVCEYFYTIP